MFSDFFSFEKYSSINLIFEDENKNKLYLGDVLAAMDTEQLKELNIRTVLTVAGGLGLSYNYLIHHHVYDVEDSEEQDLQQYFPQMHKQITDGLKRGSVLVHCAAGVSRSATVVISYLMKKNSMNYGQAYVFVKSKRMQILPNSGFQQQLRRYELQLESEKQKIQKEQEKTELRQKRRQNTILIKNITKQMQERTEKTYDQPTKNQRVLSRVQSAMNCQANVKTMHHLSQHQQIMQQQQPESKYQSIRCMQFPKSELPSIKNESQTQKSRQKFKLDLMAQKLAKEDQQLANIQKNLEKYQTSNQTQIQSKNTQNISYNQFEQQIMQEFNQRKQLWMQRKSILAQHKLKDATAINLNTSQEKIVLKKKK